MSFDPEAVARVLPVLQETITLDSITRAILRESLFRYMEEVVRTYVPDPYLLQFSTDVPDEIWMSGRDLRDQFNRLQEAILAQILAMPSIHEIVSTTTGNMIPSFIRSMISDAQEAAVKKILAETQSES